MKYLNIHTLGALIMIALSLVITTPVNAQSNYACTPFTYSMSYGGRGGDVARAQSYLISLGYLNNGSATGYYGNATRAAVLRFQSASGISGTGTMGPLTRAALYNAVCGNGQNPGNPNNNNQAPVINQISPSVGPFGTTVTIYGRNFSRNANNSINFANVNNIAVNRVSNDGTTLQFTIPMSPCREGSQVCTAIAFAPGQFPLSVTTPYGTSNSVTFTATDYGNNNTNRPPTIHSVEGSTMITVGQAGAWSVRATDPSNTYGNGSLTYSVQWGDEGQNNPYGANTSSGPSNQFVQNATFNHTYSNPGTYTVTFTVRNSYGLETRSSITVLVTGYATNQTPTITSISPAMGPFGTTVTITGRNFSRYDNAVNFAGVNRAYVNIPSTDGTTLQFTPTATPCPNGNFCAQQVLNPGDYTVSVSNQSGTSNILSYKATNGGTGNVPQSQTLSLGQSFTIGDLTFVPIAVIEDSRCGVDVTCVQAGRVAVQTAIRAGYMYNYVNLSSTDTSPFTTDSGYKIQIINVTPAKYAGQTIPNSQYKITYMISR